MYGSSLRVSPERRYVQFAAPECTNTSRSFSVVCASPPHRARESEVVVRGVMKESEDSTRRVPLTDPKKKKKKGLDACRIL